MKKVSTFLLSFFCFLGLHDWQTVVGTRGSRHKTFCWRCPAEKEVIL